MQTAQSPLASRLVTLLLPLTLTVNLHSQTKLLKAQVWEMQGSATYSTASDTPKRLNVGTLLPPGSTVRTAAGSAVDIHLGKDAGILRMTENSVLHLEKLAETPTGASSTVEVQLSLDGGSILGDVKKLAAGSKYQVKVSNGMIGVRDGQFRINAQGYLVLLEGALVMVHVPAVGDPVPHTLRAPEPVYFSPLEGIRPAPAPLVREVQNQLNAQLRVP